ncbi:DUF1190 domain-containing protein [Thalassotalea litorea]|uniref:DUF1190 domain-containing protein n=1 Tax=Thalassotalea litorea TaxID=2020715 RepID=A0A5R9ID40_9GAMM|nr:DUF1190 domain-containing protein [Thalassotalea litorea]TLU61501.1 DUF1190 domain-containing protein [Thalassotalea litorea]
MKRSQSINLSRMRKVSTSKLVKPLAVVAGVTTLTACGNDQEAIVYKDLDHCIGSNPELEQQCETAYQNALKEAQQSGPKYPRKPLCEEEFGSGRCYQYSMNNGQSVFVPLMAGFLFSQYMDNRYRSAPLYTSYSYHSPFYGYWSSVDGHKYGRARYGKTKVNKKAFDAKPKVTRTISRGGFGSKVAASSSFRGSSSRGGWGG